MVLFTSFGAFLGFVAIITVCWLLTRETKADKEDWSRDPGDRPS